MIIMINFDSLTLKVFLDENKEFFLNALIQKIQQPTRKDLIFHLRSQKQSKKFYININPECYHLCFLNEENETKRHINIPKQPPMFCMLLRKYLENAKIKDIKIPQYERILEIYIESFSEIGEKISLCFIVELMGKHSNCILINAKTKTIIGCMHNIGAEKSQFRELAGGLTYIYPPQQNKKDILYLDNDFFEAQLKNLEKNDIIKNISENYFYSSTALLSEIIDSKNPIKNINILKKLSVLNPSISCDYKNFSIFSFNKANRIHKNSVNNMIDDYFSYHIENKLTKNLKQELLTLIKKEIKKLTNSLTGQEKQINKLNDALNYKNKADLIMSNLNKICKLDTELSVKDFNSEKEVIIELNNLISPIENANKYYKLYKKYKTANNVAQEMFEKYKNQLSYYKELEFQIQNTDEYLTLSEILSEIKPKEVKKENEKSYGIKIDEIIINDFNVFIGKNNKQNDYIFSKIAKADDIWFHALGVAGAHVLIKKDAAKELDDDTILRVAKIAKKNSKSATSSKASVIYTKRKYLKHPPNTHLGYVTYREEKEIVV